MHTISHAYAVHFIARKSGIADEEGLLSVPSNKQGLDNVCVHTYVCACVHAQVSLRGAIRVGWVNGDVCGFQRNLRLCLAASLCAYVDATERERQI